MPDLATLREPAGRLLDGALGDACAGWQDQTVARPDGESGEANVHAAWRLALAGRADASSEKLAALTVAGSVGPDSPAGSLTSNWTATGSIRRVT